MKTLLIASVLALLLFCDKGLCRPSDEARFNEADVLGDQGEQDEDSDELDKDNNVTVVSKSEIIRAPVGHLAKLPCVIAGGASALDNVAITWSKNNVTITVDANILAPADDSDLQNRLILDPNLLGSIVIKDLRAEDSGNYKCQTIHNSFVTHVLDVLVPPRNVTIHPEGGHLFVKKSEHVQLTCSAQGNPPPTFQWTNKHEEVVGNSSVLDIPRIDHKFAGKYTCFAYNSEGKESRHVVISLRHRPDIKARKHYISGVLGGNAEIVCDIHHVRGDPPRVEWFRDGVKVGTEPSLQYVQNNEKDTVTKAALKVLQIREEDFATYTCSAINDLGSTESNTTLTSSPVPARLVSQSGGKNNVTLTWVIESGLPLEEIELRYKKDMASSWFNVKLNMQTATKQEDVWIVKHQLTGLDGKHHALLLTRNAAGWSPESEYVTFNSNSSSGSGSGSGSGSSSIERAEVATPVEASGSGRISQDRLCTILSAVCALILLLRLRD